MLSSSGCAAMISSESTWAWIFWAGGVQFFFGASAAHRAGAARRRTQTILRTFFMIDPTGLRTKGGNRPTIPPAHKENLNPVLNFFQPMAGKPALQLLDQRGDCAFG